MTESQARLPVREAGWSPAVVERNLSKLHETRLRARDNRRRLLLGGGALACAAAVALAWLLPFTSQGEVRESASKAASLASSALPLVGEKERVNGLQTVRFRDGSTAELLVEGSELLVTEVSERAVQVDLTEGSGRFEIVPDQKRRFRVLARGVGITVLGTLFTVDHEPTRVRVGVARGKVRVTSQLGERVLTAGEAAWFPVEEGNRMSQAGGASKNKGEDGGEEEAEGGAAAPLSVENAAQLRARFAEHHRRAEYKEAYALMAQSRAAVGSSDEDLMRAADAARYSGHPAEAVTYLRRVSRGGELATAAAFTRGRLYMHELNDPREAAQAFAEARRLAPGGTLAEDAFFREIEARNKAGETAKARALATSYLKTYPESRRRAQVARLLDKP